MKPESITDEELARQSQAGSLESFERLVHRHEAGVYRFLCACSRRETDACDLTQSTFVAAFRNLHRYRPSQPFAPWLYAIARHKFIDFYRARQREPNFGSLPEAEDAADPAGLLSRREEARTFWEEVRRLVTGDQFQALWLHYQQDLAIQEVARVMGRTATSVKVLLFRARQLLLRTLEQRAQSREGSAWPPGFGTARAGSTLGPTRAVPWPETSKETAP